MVAGRKSSSLALIASSISPEASYVAGLPGFSPTASALGSSAIVEVLGQKAVNTEQVLRRKKRTSLLYICLPSGSCFRKGSLGGSANCSLHLSPSLRLGPKLREISTSLTHTPPLCRKRLSPIPLHSAENDPSYHHCRGKFILDPY